MAASAVGFEIRWNADPRRSAAVGQNRKKRWPLWNVLEFADLVVFDRFEIRIFNSFGLTRCGVADLEAVFLLGGLSDSDPDGSGIATHLAVNAEGIAEVGVADLIEGPEQTDTWLNGSDDAGPGYF